MAQSTDQYVVAGNGNVFVGPTDSTAPTDATSDPTGDGFTDLGLLTDAGPQITDGKTVVDVLSWQLFYPGRKIVSARAFTVGFSLQQWNAATIAFAFGGGAITGSGDSWTYTPPDPQDLDERSLIVDGIDGDRQYRFYVPRGIVTDNVQFNFARAAASALPIVFSIIGTPDEAPWLLFAEDDQFSTT